MSSFQNYLLLIFLFIIIMITIIAPLNYYLIEFPLPEVTASKEHSHATPNNLSVLKGNISEVYDNNTVQLNGTLNVKLSFVKHYVNDTTMKEDATHYTSVLCPIRSPSIVYAKPQTTNQFNFPFAVKENSHSINGVLFCQSKNISDTLNDSSINEDLISLKMAIFDNNSCNEFEKAVESIKIKFGCG